MSYTPIIIPDDLKTHIYPEILEEISRADDTIITTAIDNGISEVKIYLSRYDLTQLFGDAGTDTAASFTDPYLTGICKDVICWNLIKLANPNVNYQHIRQCYDDAITALKMIQAGKANPNWPYLDPSGITTPPGISVSIIANTKRNNRY
jgi:hypothetical protein